MGPWLLLLACEREGECSTFSDCVPGGACLGGWCVALPDASGLGPDGRPEIADMGDMGDVPDMPDMPDMPCVPEPAETCNGQDDDCDGRADEDIGGVCAVGDDPACTEAGTRVCIDGVEACQAPVRRSSPEIECDGRDDDCDGATDEGASDVLADEQRGVCAGSTTICDMAGDPEQPGEADIEDAEFPDERSCDGLDNDCDGMPDEAGALDLELAEEQRGVCAGMRLVCRGGMQVEPDDDEKVSQAPAYTPEIDDSCDGDDNDCDGRVDEDPPPADGIILDDGQVLDGLPAPCTRARQRCGPDGWTNPTLAEIAVQAERAGEAGEPWEGFIRDADVCDGLDNDCDGATDEDEPDVLAANQNGVCRGMTVICVDGVPMEPPVESAPGYEAGDTTCNGVDNNCDSTLDTGADAIGVAPPHSDDEGVCAEDAARQVCVQLGEGRAAYQDRPDGEVPGFEADDTTCDGINADCDGRTDEGYTPESCGPEDLRYGGERGPDPPLAEANRSICVKGGTRCGGGRARCDDPQPATGRDEVCDDGRDNDCDGWTDEGCLGGPCRVDDCPAGVDCPDPAPCPPPPEHTTSTCVGEGDNGRCGFGPEGGRVPLDDFDVAGCSCRTCLGKWVGGEQFGNAVECARCEARLNACGGSDGLPGQPGYCVAEDVQANDVCRRVCDADADCRPGWRCQALSGARLAWEIVGSGAQKRPREKDIPAIDAGLRFCLPE